MNTNPYFSLKIAAEGVWAAIAVPGSGALGNAAIIDLGDHTVVVDTFRNMLQKRHTAVKRWKTGWHGGFPHLLKLG